MNDLIKSLRAVLKNKDSRRILIGSSLLFFLAVILTEKATALSSVLTQNFTASQKITLLFTYVFDLRSSFTLGTLTLITAGSILGGINLALAYIYFKTHSKAVASSGLYSGAGFFFALLGVGCAACGTALLSTILGFLGLSFILGFLPYQGLEIGYLGLLILGLATMSLSKKVVGPKVC